MSVRLNILRNNSPFAMLVVAGFLSGCSISDQANANTDGAPDAAYSRAAGGEQTPQLATNQVNLSDDDKRAFLSAEASCRAGDFNGFFDQIVYSQAVRAKNSKSQVTVATYATSPAGGNSVLQQTKTLSAAEFASDRNFPLEMMDSYFVLSRAAYAANGYTLPNNRDHVALEFDQGQNEAYVVSFVPTRYESDGTEEGDSLGRAVGTFGDRGEILFEPNGDCWQIAELRVFKDGGN